MGFRVTHVMGLLPATFQLPSPSSSQLMVRHGTDRYGLMDRQSMAIITLCPILCGFVVVVVVVSGMQLKIA